MIASPTIPPLIQANWLAAHLDDPTIRILDSNTNLVPDPQTGGDRVQPERPTFEAGHIPGAQFIDLQADLSDPGHPFRFMMPPPEQFARQIEAFGVGDDTHVVLYSSGNVWWATRVWWMLRACGFDRASILDGGIRAWREGGYPVETGPGGRYPRGRFTVREVRPLLVGRDEVMAAVGDGAVCTLNALAPLAHAGQARTSLARAGRIAGSVNVSAATLIDPATGRFKELDALRAAFAASGALDRRVIAYCGGGVSATADAFALTLLGHRDVVVYDGSMQEWASDPALPMERNEVPA